MRQSTLPKRKIVRSRQRVAGDHGWHVLAQARRRIKRKLEGAKEGIRICVVRADAQRKQPKLHQYRKWLRGIGYIRDNRYMALNEGVETWLNADEPPD